MINTGTIIVDNVKPTLLSNLSGSGQLLQAGAGTTTLDPGISYTGATTIDGGTLALASGASLSSSSGVTLQTLTSGGRAALVAAPYSSSNNNFGAIGSPSLDISLAGNQTIASLNGDSTGTVHLGANVLTVNASGSSTFDGQLVDGGIGGGVGGALSKTGTGPLILGGANTYTGGTTVSAGLLLIEPTTPSTSALPKGVLTITGGKTQLASNVTLGSGAAASNVNLSSLSITGTGQLDITNNHIIIDYGGSDPMSAIYGYLKSGYNNASWNGPGIISSAAQAATNNLSYGIGYADGNDNIVSGLSGGQIELKYTLLGDANLDGVVNGSDFSILAANFGQGITNWDQGNFLFTAAVNGSDFSALAADFGQGDNGAAVAVSRADVAALDAFASANGLPAPAIGVVPEPASAGLTVGVGVGILVRRRRGGIPRE
jgi:autotransporter-associated beta strand protein